MSRQVLFLVLFFVVAGSWGLAFASKRLESVAEGVIPLDPRSFDALTVVAVGTGGTHENHHRLGPCIAVALEDTVVLVDAGRGLAPALRSAGLPVAQPRTLLLTTLLPENTVGVADWLTTAALETDRSPLQVFGPPGTSALVQGIVAAHADGLAAQLALLDLPAPAEVDVRDAQQGALEFEAGPLRLIAAPLAGGPFPAVAWRLEGGGASVVVSGVGWDPDAVASIARDTDLLVHEAISATALAAAAEAGVEGIGVLQAEGALHQTIEEIGLLATRARARALALVRVRPPPVFDFPVGGYRSLVAAHYRGQIFLPEDGEELPVVH
jgi:ribonuclease Z